MKQLPKTLLCCAVLLLAAPAHSQTERQQCLGVPVADGVERQFADMQLRQQVHQVDQLVLQAWQAIPHEQREVAALQQQLGDDPVELYRWVRDNTHWLPYDGALRGARGTLLDRAGSSLDRALLLAELLREAGENVRLVQAPLTAAQQQELSAYWLEHARPQPQLAAAPSQQQFTAWAAELDRPVAELQQLVTRQREQATSYLETVATQVQQQVAQLQQLTQVQPVAAAPVQHYWWVQWQGSEGWRDLDPAMREQAFGQSWLTSNPNDLTIIAVEQLPPEAKHQLRIQVVAEQLYGAKLHEHVALDHTFDAIELTQQQLKLSVTPVNFPTVGELLEGSLSARAAEQQLLDQKQWLPAIKLGDDSIMQQAIAADGSLEDPLTGQVSTSTTAALSSALDELSSMNEAPQTEQPAELSAVYIRYEITAPGQEKRVYQRPLMDVLSATERQQLAAIPDFTTERYQQRGAQLLSDVVLLAQNSHSNEAENTAQRLRDILVHRAEIQGLASVIEHGNVDLVEPIVAGATTRNSLLDLLTFYRFLVSPYASDVVLTELNLLSYVQLANYDQGIAVQTGFDIISNPVTALIADPSQRAQTQVAQGVVDTLLEVELLDPEQALALANNTSRSFAYDRAHHRPWLTVNDSAQLAQLSWLPDSALKSHLQEQLAAGKVIMAPQQLRAGEAPSWWSYDPVRGQLLGYDRTARGAQISEALVNVMSSLSNASAAVEMVQSVVGCLMNYSNYDPVCCIGIEAAKHFGGDFLKDTALARAQARWIQLFQYEDKTLMFFFDNIVSTDIGALVDPVVKDLGNYGMNKLCKV
ncbi:hypothetical protein [Pseudidiomarina salilacus]|uniref:hypothetical protein n=1 Tax=Pseudidiomarina salilacus TaxID=3384452 RepID=UPI0039850FCB